MTDLVAQDDVQIDKLGQMLLPDLYTIIVARSGSGKTMTQKAITKALGMMFKTPTATGIEVGSCA